MSLYRYICDMFALAKPLFTESMLAESILAKSTISKKMLAETSFIVVDIKPINMLKHEAIDRLYSVADDHPKYKAQLEELIKNFTVEDMLYLMNTIYRDEEFRSSQHFKLYNRYFDEIEDLTHKYIPY
jgi:hypothetical protein